jgi:hypothetical protein
VTATPEKTAPELKLILAREDITVTSVRQIEPSLEDVFVSVLGDMEEKEPANVGAN